MFKTVPVILLGGILGSLIFIFYKALEGVDEWKRDASVKRDGTTSDLTA